MVRKPRKPSRPRKPASTIRNPLQSVSASTRSFRYGSRLVPTLVLRGAWLKAVGFPIGTTVFVVSDKRGEVMLGRSGIRLPRLLRIVGTKE